MAYKLSRVKEKRSSGKSKNAKESRPTGTVDEAVDRLSNELSLKDKIHENRASSIIIRELWKR